MSRRLNSLLALVDVGEVRPLTAVEAGRLRVALRAQDAARRSAGGLQRSLLDARRERDAARTALAAADVGGSSVSSVAASGRGLGARVSPS